MATCSCGVGNMNPSTAPQDCLVHGTRAPRPRRVPGTPHKVASPPKPPAPTTGAPEGEAGAPVVDLTALVRQLYEDADGCRVMAHNLRQKADHLEQLASTLSGGSR